MMQSYVYFSLAIASFILLDIFHIRYVKLQSRLTGQREMLFLVLMSISPEDGARLMKSIENKVDEIAISHIECGIYPIR